MNIARMDDERKRDADELTRSSRAEGDAVHQAAAVAWIASSLR